MARPRAADDFGTIRARMEELRRERAQAVREEAQGSEEAASGGRNLLRVADGRKRLESERLPAAPSSRRYGSGR